MIKPITLLFFILGVCADDLYDLVLHPHDRGAACLDGSPAGMYLHEGKGQNKNNFMIYFDSGGFCGAETLDATLESCYKRSFTSLGTTTVYKQQKSFLGEGLLSPDPTENPVFHDWTKIFAIYCDGVEHQGYRQAPVNYKGRDLFFRGTRNSLQQFYYLDQKYDFYNKGKIVITGVSAGGMATFQWVQYLRTHTKSAKVYGIPDSGLFGTDYYSPIVDEKVIRVRAQSILKLVGNLESEMPQPVRKCYDQIEDLVSCYDASNYGKYLNGPLLMIQSPYDEWALDNLLVVQCLTNKHYPFSIQSCNQTTRDVIQDYRKTIINKIYKIKGNRTDIGVFGPACVQHGFTDESSFTSGDYRVPSGIGMKIDEVIKQFLENPEKAPWLLDEGEWPTVNKGCNGLASHHLSKE